MKPLTREILRGIPKVELHRHLELSVRHSTLRELAPKAGIKVDTQAEFDSRFVIREPMIDLGSVLNKFLDTQKLLSSTEVLERIAYEACEDAHREGIRVLELRYAPTFVRLGHESLSFSDIHQAFVRGVRKAEANFPIAVGLLCIIQRILPVREAEAVTEFAIENKDTFVGLDLADNEVGFDSKPFAPFFLKAKKAGLGITVHSGEANVPKAPQYVLEAIEYLGADRIGHGVQIHCDEKVMAAVRDRGIPLELCPTSNWLTSAVPSTAAHPIRRLMEFGVKVTINTDDPGIFAIDLVHEYEILHQELKFSATEFSQCNEIAKSVSFVPSEKIAKVW